MRLVIIGSEFVGKTTLAAHISDWSEKHLGQRVNWHDEWVLTDEQLHDEVRRDLEKMSTTTFETFRHYALSYHLNPGFFKDNDHCLVGFYFSEAVYAPLYHGYGGKGTHSDLEIMVAHWDRELMTQDPNTVLVTMTASPEAIRQRMTEPNARKTVLQSEDVEAVIKRFEELAARSFIRRRVALDTSESTPESTFAEFLEKFEPHFSQVDRMRLLTHQAMAATDSD